MNDFAESRRKYIGSSDVGPILGVCSWATKYDIFLQKLGLQEVESTERMQTGNDIEGWIVTERYIPAMDEVNTSIRVVKPPKLVHPDYPWFAVHCDGLVYSMYPDAARYIQAIDLDPESSEIKSGPALCGLEVKNIQIKKKEIWGEPGTDQIPATYWWQCQACMEVTDVDVWDVAVFFGGNRFELFRVHRDKEKMARAMVELIEFQGRRKANDPPPIDESESANQFLSTWYREEEDIEFVADLEVDKAVHKRFGAILEIAEQKAIKIECENIICDKMKIATTLIGSDYKGTWKFEPKRKVNWEAIACDLHAMHKEFDPVDFYTDSAGMCLTFESVVTKHTTKPQPKKRTFRLRKQKAAKG